MNAESNVEIFVKSALSDSAGKAMLKTLRRKHKTNGLFFSTEDAKPPRLLVSERKNAWARISRKLLLLVPCQCALPAFLINRFGTLFGSRQKYRAVGLDDFDKR
jgi:hypothetical protein